MRTLFGRALVPGLVALGLSVALWQRYATPARAYEAPPLAIGVPGGPSTSRADLDRTVASLEARITRDGATPIVASRLADALRRWLDDEPGMARTQARFLEIHRRLRRGAAARAAEAVGALLR